MIKKERPPLIPLNNYLQQMKNSEELQRKMHEDLIASGFVNTVHDCYELVVEEKRDDTKS